MPLIKDVQKRRFAFLERSQEVDRRYDDLLRDPSKRLTIATPDLSELEHYVEAYVNRDMLLRTNRACAEEIRNGKSDWPEETQYSRLHFRADDRGITNPAYYALFVEEQGAPGSTRAAPRNYEPQPIKRFVDENWIPLARADIAAQQRRRDRGA